MRLTDLFVVMIQIQINDVNKTVKLKNKTKAKTETALESSYLLLDLAKIKLSTLVKIPDFIS